MKQQKACCLTTDSQFLFKPRKFLKNRSSNDMSFETIRYSKRNWKSGMKFIEFTTKFSKFRTCFVFDNIVSILDLFRNFTSIRNTKRSGLRRVVTGSISKRYYTSLFAQLSKISLENVKFDLICPMFNIQNLQAKH